MSMMGPMSRKAMTGVAPKLERRLAPIKASASLQSERTKAKAIMTKIAVKEFPAKDVRMRVGR